MATAVVTDFYLRTTPAAPHAKVLRLAQQLTMLFGEMVRDWPLCWRSYRWHRITFLLYGGFGIIACFAIGSWRVCACRNRANPLAGRRSALRDPPQMRCGKERTCPRPTVSASSR